MNTKNMWCGLVTVLLMAAPLALLGDEKTATTAPSVKKGDPPPGNAMTLSIPQARAAIKEATEKKYSGTMKYCQRIIMVKACETFVLSAATDVHVRTTSFNLATSYTDKVVGASATNMDGKVAVNFKKDKDQDYIQAYRLRLYPGTSAKVDWFPNPLYNVGYLPDPEHSPMAWATLEWSDATAAQEFADAFNRLLYAAYRDEEATAFRAAAQAWRENPAKPPLSPEPSRHRILAEHAFQEKDFDGAVEHYESGLEIQPMWPEGWFNLALIYAELKNYADATDRMKHYLELVPDAPDANDARTQMIIWEDKAAKH